MSHSDFIRRMRELSESDPEEAARAVREVLRDSNSSSASSPRPIRPAHQHTPVKTITPLIERNEDHYWRDFHHPSVEVLKADTQGTTYRVNKHAFERHLDVHRDFVDMFQMLYDLKPIIDNRRMSTTGYMKVLEELEEKYFETDQLFLDRDLLQRFSGRHLLSLSTSSVRSTSTVPAPSTSGSPSLTIRTKANWARSETATMRNRLPKHKAASTAKQIDWIAEMHVRALRLPSYERQPALDRIKKTILIDTRSAAGLPRHMRDLPISPPQGSFASLNEWSPGVWGLWIRTTESTAESNTDNQGTT
jgi:hypothetical protein